MEKETEARVKILHLEDNDNDSVLLSEILERDGLDIDIHRVETEKDFLAALTREKFDLIISDYTLPSFNGARALEIARQKKPETPYMFFSGTIGEEAAVESMTRGAVDYVLKNNVSRLIPAVRRALREAEEKIRRKRAEEEIIRQKIYFQQLFENAPIAIVMLDDTATVLHANKSFESIFHYPAEHVRGKSLCDLIIPNDQIANAPELFFINTTEPVIGKETVRKRKDDALINVNMHTVPLMINNNPIGIYAMYEDITDKKKLEQQFLRVQRIESIGTLAGGIAHDLNNVLAPILLSIEVLKRKFDGEKKYLNMFDILHSSALRGSNLVKQVLLFARGVNGEHSSVVLKKLVEETQKIVHQTFPRSITIGSEIQKDLWQVSGDATQLHQVLLNLCVNARDAMAQGGTLSISAENVVLDEHYAKMHPEARPGKYVLLKVTDNGAGMPEGVKEKIFEPFFTTKELGKGTGLGLSTSLGIVRGHQGFINVYSEQGKGTTFSIYLPALQENVITAKKEAKVQLPQGKNELVLIVDDEASIREITKETLESYGYRAMQAGDGTEALVIYAHHWREIDIVLVDMMMPFLDGHSTVRALRKINPNAKIIASSGLASNNNLAPEESQAFLAKPYTAEQLLTTLHKLLRKA